MTEAQIIAKARAIEAIRKADETLSAPRPQARAWQPPAQVDTVPAATPVKAARPAPRAAAPSLNSVASAVGKSLAPIMGKVFREELAQRDAKIAELELRVASMEAIINRAKGQAQ